MTIDVSICGDPKRKRSVDFDERVHIEGSRDIRGQSTSCLRNNNFEEYSTSRNVPVTALD